MADPFANLDELTQTQSRHLRKLRTPEAATAQRRRLVTLLQSDPLVLRWVAKARTTKIMLNKAPWMALAEQRIQALYVASDQPVRITGLEPGSTDSVTRAILASQLLASMTYLWSRKIIDLVESYPLPRHVVDRDVLPFPWSFHSTETAYELTTTEHTEGFVPGSDTNWTYMGYNPVGKGMDVVRDIIPPAGPMTLDFFIIRFGKRYPNDFEPPARAPVAQILKRLAFIRSPFCEVEERKLPRAMRRHGALPAGDIDKTVGVVVLRRAAQQSVDAYEAESKEFKHRWWISGHFRSQWYPSRNAHEIIWIAPYLKGPESAPLLEKVYSVIR